VTSSDDQGQPSSVRAGGLSPSSNRVLQPGPVIGLAISHLRAASGIFKQAGPMFELEAREVQLLVDRLDAERDGVPILDSSVLMAIDAHLDAVRSALDHVEAVYNAEHGIPE